MFKNIKLYNVLVVMIFAASVILFNGSYNSETENYPAAGYNKSYDIDYLEAQKLIDAVGQVTLTPLFSPVIFPEISTILNPAEVYLPAPDFLLADTLILPGNPGPPNNGGSAGWAMFLDLIAGPRDVQVVQMKTGSSAAASSGFTVEIFTRSGTALGGPVSSGPGSSTAGWTSIGTAPVVQGSTSSGISEVFTIPAITVTAGDTVGVAIRFSVAGPRYFGSGSPPLSVYTDTNITMVSGDGRSAPFTPTGSFFSSRTITGEIRYVVSTTTGISTLNNGIPENFRLEQNYPNPFNPVTTIEFSVPLRSNVSLKVFNLHGQLVTTLAGGMYSAGVHSIKWNAENFASGVYFYTLNADNFTQTRKLIFIK